MAFSFQGIFWARTVSKRSQSALRPGLPQLWLETRSQYRQKRRAQDPSEASVFSLEFPSLGLRDLSRGRLGTLVKVRTLRLSGSGSPRQRVRSGQKTKLGDRLGGCWQSTKKQLGTSSALRAATRRGLTGAWHRQDAAGVGPSLGARRKGPESRAMRQVLERATAQPPQRSRADGAQLRAHWSELETLRDSSFAHHFPPRRLRDPRPVLP